jgi:acyl transferase domain-containing protein
MDNYSTQNLLDGIAVIGMDGKFPGAKTIDDFWQNLCNGVESISFFTDEELVAAGVSPETLSDPKYVKAGSVLPDIEMFDASFFGFSTGEAKTLDPQHRLLLECAWSAIEDAGYNSEAYDGRIGVYTGASFSTYLHKNLLLNPDFLKSAGDLQVEMGNDKDFISTRISYKMNLRGPSVCINTACSSSLVAVHMACQGLLDQECDMALAGGVTIQVPKREGYFYQKGGINSPDGHCRPFDAKAQGTVFGSGAGLVILKRLEDALIDGDHIYATIRGSAINNDGALKVGYTAPSVDGQAEVIAEAMSIAGVDPETITYIETHGTATAMGDPIEVAGLTKVFRNYTEKKGFCALGSVKSNIGHLNRAAGVVGLIKTILMLKHKMLTPTLNFEQPNPQIDFANSPFYVNTTLKPWKVNGILRRAGVSSFGIGGTNAHVILEEAPATEPSSNSRPWQLLVLSAKTDVALEMATQNLARHLAQNPELNLADVAFTLQVGRQVFKHRRMLVCQTLEESVTALKTLGSKYVFTNFQNSKSSSIVFMFPGQGAQYANMALELYQVEPIFREQVDLCSNLLKPHLKLDLRNVLYPDTEKLEQAKHLLKQTSITQPALFVIEYALAQLWMSWGIRPQGMIGHSIGEYVAATLAGVLSLEDALVLVAARGRLMQQLPSGAMLSVFLPEQEVQSLLGEKLSLAAINGLSLCVVSGPVDAMDALEQQLLEQGKNCRLLHTSHAFHSQMMEPILGEFTELVKTFHLNSPQIPYISNVTGTWITAQEAIDPAYWATHMRQTVRFAEGMQEVLSDPERILLEIGPGQTLKSLTRQHPDTTERIVLSSLRHPKEQSSSVAFLLKNLGQLWLSGVNVDWMGLYVHEKRHRLSLPTYPFQRKQYWVGSCCKNRC